MLTSDQIAAAIVGRTAKEIATGVADLAHDGKLTHGDRLPTVRSLAQALNVSPSTVAQAWSILTNHGLIETARRNGTTIRAPRRLGPGRYWQVPASPGAMLVDVSTGTPDPDLLPPVGPILNQIQADLSTASYITEPVLPALNEILQSRWPTPVEALTVVDGAMDGLDRVIAATVRLGDRVVVEDPTFPPLLDMLDLAGAELIGVPVDDEGIELEGFTEALQADPVLCVIQPRRQNPTGARLSDVRLKQLVEAHRDAGSTSLILEDDHSGAHLEDGALTFGHHLPEATVSVVSFSKSHGPDLRIAAVGGPADIVEDVTNRRRLGPVWTSHLIQLILTTMLDDTATIETVAAARMVYTQRRRALHDALAERGVVLPPGEGLNLWIPVADEQRATLGLAFERIGAAAGRPFRVQASSAETDPHIRVSIGTARGDLDELAESLAKATQL
jgi:DNA-binding transcriptional MocR family regulator